MANNNNNKQQVSVLSAASWKCNLMSIIGMQTVPEKAVTESLCEVSFY
jgi:hypothetical protein